MIRLPLDIAACYEAMREQAAKNANFDILADVRKRLGQEIDDTWVKIDDGNERNSKNSSDLREDSL